MRRHLGSFGGEKKLELGEDEWFGRKLVGLKGYMTYRRVSGGLSLSENNCFLNFLLSTIEKHGVSVAISSNRNRVLCVLRLVRDYSSRSFELHILKDHTAKENLISVL